MEIRAKLGNGNEKEWESTAWEWGEREFKNPAASDNARLSNSDLAIYNLSSVRHAVLSEVDFNHSSASTDP